MKKILFTLVIVLSTVCAIAQTNTNRVTLAWNASCDTNVVSYKVLYGIGGILITNIVQAYTDDCGLSLPTRTNVYHQPYTNTIVVLGRTNSTATISNLVNGATYYFTAKCANAVGLESDFSNEVSYTVPIPPVPPTAPTDFRTISGK